MKHLRILFVAVVAFFVAVSPAAAISLVEAGWLAKNLNNADIRIVDVQEKSSNYAKEHIPGAVAVNRYVDLADTNQAPPFLYPTAEQFEKVLSRLGIGKNTIVVAYDDKFSLFAARFLVLMEYFGHDVSKLKLLDGGLVNWKLEGNAVESAPAKVSPTTYKIASVNQNMLLTWSDIYRDVVQGVKPQVFLLDVRPGKEYNAENIRGIRGGHLPKSVNVTGSDANDQKTHKFKSIADIQKMYADKGATSDKEIYMYCHSGDRAAHAYLQLKHLLKYPALKLYPGGWEQWGGIISLPAEGQVWLWDAPKPAAAAETKKPAEPAAPAAPVTDKPAEKGPPKKGGDMLQGC
ncbi:MAG TPA: rhodanese-like domain-containing protein [Geopsychrobacteraceae bacterium]